MKLIKDLKAIWHFELRAEIEACNRRIMSLMKQIDCKPETELAFLCDLYGSDKGSICCEGTHTYTDTYSLLFSHIRNRVQAVFECGIFRGASLRVWQDYFPNAMIIGGDINRNFLFEEPRIHTGLVDQMNPEKIKKFLSSLMPKYRNDFDIIIDDGCHTYEANICLFENSINYLKPNGIYIIEDIPEKYFSAYKQHFKKYIDENKITMECKIMPDLPDGNPDNLITIHKTGNWKN